MVNNLYSLSVPKVKIICVCTPLLLNVSLSMLSKAFLSPQHCASQDHMSLLSTKPNIITTFPILQMFPSFLPVHGTFVSENVAL